MNNSTAVGRLTFLTLFIVGVLAACDFEKNYDKTENGVTVHLGNKESAKTIKVVVVDDDIIHVMASPADSILEGKSLMTVPLENHKTDWTVEEKDGVLLLSTARITASVSLDNGNVEFMDKDGKKILAERKEKSKIFKPVELDGQQFYSIQQVFQSPDDEAFYGLGQHQNGQMNYKGEDVELAQHNIVAAVPFLYSNKNYGILWDNYSITRFGDPREYQPISTLDLYGKDGTESGLTASYYQGDTLFLERAEDTLDYQYIESQKNWPAGFTPSGTAKVVWEGAIGSDVSGIHKFKLYGSEYFKLWIDGKLILDRWRQNWNPWYHNFNLAINKGEKHSIKIEWIPNGGYLALLHLDPQNEQDQKDLSLFSEVANQIDYYFIYGNNADEVIGGYRKLTGKAPIVPKWAMGYWQSRERYKTQEELLGVVKEYRKRKIPLDNIVLDWFYWPVDKWGSHDFDKERFPQPQKMVQEVHDLNARIMISVWPKFYPGTNHFHEMNEKGFLYQRNLEKNEKDWVSPGYNSTFYDAINVEAGKLFWKQIDNKLNKIGIDAWWLDATEPDIHSNLSVAERKLRMNPTALGPGAEYFNAFSLMNSKGVYEGDRKADPDKRTFILTRSAYAGQQRYGAATWSGDVVSRWKCFAEQIPAGINFSMSGIPYWTTDIGGFALESRFTNPQGEDLKEWQELNTRWFQFAAFCPLFRSHGQFPYREIYNLSKEGSDTYNSMVFYDKLRYRLMPYIYTLAGKAYHDDYTLMRGLVMDFPDDKDVLGVADQYMFGPSLLVNPVTSYKARTRAVYLPKATAWYDFYSGNYFDGGQKVEAEAPLDRMPLFVRAGSIIPVGPELQYSAEKKEDPITLYVYTGRDGDFTLYEDEGVNYNYENGEFSNIKITYNEGEKTLTIGKREGKFSGMPESRTFAVVWISKKRAVPFSEEEKKDETIEYSGEKIKIKMKQLNSLN